MPTTGFVLAALVGLSLGLLGGGGSVLTVPILVYAVGFDAKTAIAMSLLIVGTTSLVGAVSHWRAGNVRLQTALPFGLAAMAGAFAGARLTVLLSGAVQLTLLGVVMLVAAVAMFRGGIGPGEPRDGVGEPSLGLLLVSAVGVGLLTGVVGVGGGFLIVPALVLLAHVPMKRAVGTSLIVIAMNSAAGFAGYFGRVEVPWDYVAGFTAIAIGGILAGTALVRHVPAAHLRRAFSIFLVGVGVFTLYRNRAVLGVGPAEPQPPALAPDRR